MNPSDVARRFERRHGYDLIDYAEVALPLYRLTVDAITMVHHDIPPIKEFVMRSIAIGLDNAAEIGCADFDRRQHSVEGCSNRGVYRVRVLRDDGRA